MTPSTHRGLKLLTWPNRLACASVAVLLAGCVSTPPPPDWLANAFASLNRATSAYLSGDTRVAELEWARARAEVARTGRPELMARLALVRCATQVASLDWQPCSAYQAVAVDAAPAEQAYAAFLAGAWTQLDARQLPAHYQPLLTSAPAPKPLQAGTPASPSPLLPISDPLARLIAASLLHQQGRLTPPDLALAVEAAASQGWRRPLLAWLGVQRQTAQQQGDHTSAERAQRRLNLMLPEPGR